jgi:hypothetical protein
MARMLGAPGNVFHTAAVNEFFTQYVHPGCRGKKSDFDFVLDVYNSSASTGMLADVIDAVGTLLIIRRSNYRSLNDMALNKYAQALKKLRKSIEQSQDAESDQTLATISLLALHESLTAGVGCPTAWDTVHLDGATRLLCMRGTRQFEAAVGHRVFLRLCTQIASPPLIEHVRCATDNIR